MTYRRGAAGMRRWGGVVLAGAVAVGGLLVPQAHAATTIRSALTLVGGEDPTIDPLNPAIAEARWAAPSTRRIDITGLDPARFPESVAGAGGPCITTMSVGSLSGEADIIADPTLPGTNTAGLRDAGPGADGQLAKVDIVCDFLDGATLVHHETHWAGELGFAPVASLPSSVAFDALRVGSLSDPQTVTLTNIGNVPMSVTSVQLSGAGASQFGLVDNQCGGVSLDPNASCVVSVNFAPTKAGNLAASLVFSDNAPGGTQSVSLSALGLEPNIVITPDHLRFGDQLLLLGTTVRTIKVTNTGNMDLTLGAWKLTGDPDFTIVSDTCSNAIVAANGTCSLTVQFQPLLLGARTALIDAVSDAPASAQHAISINGTGKLI